MSVTVKESALAPMVRQIGRYAELSNRDRSALDELPFAIRTMDAGCYLAREGDPVREHVVLLSGYTQRHKLARSGGRQIVAIQIPGEAISCSGLFFDRSDHSTQTLTSVTAAAIPRDLFRELVLTRRAIGEAILRMTLVEGSIANEWLLNMGRRPAKTRVAHLLCELAARLDAAGLTDGSCYDIPLTQEQLGDALGLTAVHVNRMLRQLEEDGLVLRDGRRMRFPDRQRLAREAEFSLGYLR